MQRVAVIGSGISGLAAAWQLSAPGARVKVTLFEAGAHFGGHANTVDVTLGGVTQGVDTGFLVYNERCYPALIRLFGELGVEVAKSDMSFSVQVPRPDGSTGLEWSGTSLDSLFAQRRNLLRWPFWRMLVDIVRFNRLCTQVAETDGDVAMTLQSTQDFLDEHRFSASFREDYLLPMIGCIWSCPTGQMLSFPIGTLIRFCANHGLIQLANRPQWHTVRGGSRNYVRRMVERIPDARLHTPVRGVQRFEGGVRVQLDSGSEPFDAVVFACHSDQALHLLGNGASSLERQVLGAIRYQSNTAVLHTDTSVLPKCRKAWAAWNYERARAEPQEHTRVCLHYMLNRLQPLPWQQPVLVSLNPARQIAESHVHQRIEYAHPVFDLASTGAQRHVPLLQGQQRSWFCGAWTGYGFHEDGLRSGLEAAAMIEHALPLVAQFSALDAA